MRVWAPTKPANGPSVSAAVAGAQCGVPYDAQVQLTPGWRVVELSLDSISGLSHDPAVPGRVHGTPRRLGNIQLGLLVAHTGGSEQPLDIQLHVSPDPRSLWKDLPSDPTARFAKPPRAALQQHAHGVELLAVSCRGRMHANVAGFRDDDVRVSELPGNWLVLIAADGAGSARYSREGSRLAAQSALDRLNTCLHASPDADPIALLSDAARAALAAIDTLAAVQGCPSRDFHTTLLVALCNPQSPQRVVVLQIGDGLIAAISADGRWSAPLGLADHGDFHGQTRFLSADCVSQDSLGRRIRQYELADLRYLLVATDGIVDPYFETESAHADPVQCAAFGRRLETALLDAAGPLEGLHAWLADFTPGHHDDRTLAVARWPQ